MATSTLSIIPGIIQINLYYFTDKLIAWRPVFVTSKIIYLWIIKPIISPRKRRSLVWDRCASELRKSAYLWLDIATGKNYGHEKFNNINCFISYLIWSKGPGRIVLSNKGPHLSILFSKNGSTLAKLWPILQSLTLLRRDDSRRW